MTNVQSLHSTGKKHIFLIPTTQVGDAEVSWEFDQPTPVHLGMGEEGRRVLEQLESQEWWVAPTCLARSSLSLKTS